jgi:hypothetical protein
MVNGIPTLLLFKKICTDSLLLKKSYNITKMNSINIDSTIAESVKVHSLCYSTCEAPPKSSPSRMEEDGSVFNFNKGKDDEGCFKFCNILKWSATV